MTSLVGALARGPRDAAPAASDVVSAVGGVESELEGPACAPDRPANEPDAGAFARVGQDRAPPKISAPWRDKPGGCRGVFGGARNRAPWRVRPIGCRDAVVEPTPLNEWCRAVSETQNPLSKTKPPTYPIRLKRARRSLAPNLSRAG